MQVSRIIAVAWLTLCCTMAAGHAERRVALVVGNGAYRHADALDNPVNDARGVRDALKKLGFNVTYGENLDQGGLRHAMGQFARTVNGAAVAIVYFAGHGATFGDTPYVVPVDAEFSSLEQVPYELIPVEALIGELRHVDGVRIAILDACRDDAAERGLKRRGTGMRGGDLIRGLAPLKNPAGLILAYATQYLSTAADSARNAHSPFTAALLHNIATPGLDVKDLFFRVGQEVVTTTDNLQRPEISISMYEPYELVPAAVAPTVAAPVSATPAEATIAPLTPPLPAPVPARPAAGTVVPLAPTVPEPAPATPAEDAVAPGAVTAPVTKPAEAAAAAPTDDDSAPAKSAGATAAPSGRRPGTAAGKPVHGRRTASASSADRVRHEHRRFRGRAETSEPVIKDCMHVSFPQCSRGGLNMR